MTTKPIRATTALAASLALILPQVAFAPAALAQGEEESAALLDQAIADAEAALDQAVSSGDAQAIAAAEVV